MQAVQTPTCISSLNCVNALGKRPITQLDIATSTCTFYKTSFYDHPM